MKHNRAERGAMRLVHAASIRTCSAALLILVSVMTTSAATRITRTFGDWAVSCTQIGVSSRCVLIQTIHRLHSKQRVAAWVVFHNKNKKVTNRIIVPTGLNVADGIQLELNKKRVTIPYSMCTRRVCQAVFVMDDTIEKALQSEKPIVVHLVTARRRTLKLTFSTKKFGAAFAEFNKPSEIPKP